MAETLELQIKTTADQAAKSIGNLESKLRSLGSVLSSINGSNLHNFSSGLSELSKSVRGLSGIDTRTFSKVAQNMQKLGNLDTARLVSSSAALGNMSKQLASFAGISKQSDNIVQVTKAISKLGSKSAGNAANNIRELGTALKQTLTTLSTAPTVSKNIIEMTNALARLASQGSKVQSASKGITSTFNSVSTQSEGLKSKLSGLTKSTSSTSGGFKGLASTLGKFYATYWMVIRATSKLRDAVDLSSQLTEVQNVVDTTFGNMAGKLDDFTKTSIQDFGMSELTAKQTASRFQAMGSAMGISSAQVASGTKLINDKLAETKDTAYSSTQSLADMSLNLTKLTADIASFYDKDQADVAEDLSAIYTGMVVPLRKYGLDLTQATLSEWAMANGLDSDVKSMTQAEKTMLRYQYVMANTTAAQGDFAKTADTWANSVRTLKQEFQAWGSIIGGTIINAFKPLVHTLNAVMLKVISFTQTVANALGAIFGWTVEISGAGALDDTMSDAADSAGDVADSTGDAAKNVKDMVNGARKFDELNIISLNKDSGKGKDSGGGSGAGAGSGTKSSLKKVDGLVEKYKSSIKSLYDLGAYIGKAITDSLNSINWQSVYSAADNFGTGLAEFLNGLISPELFGALGRTIAGALNTVLHFLDSFGTTFDWTNFGMSIATGINEFFTTFDFALLGETISTWIIGIEDTIIAFLDTVDWELIPHKIVEFLTAVDWVGILSGLAELVWSAFNAALELTYGTLDAITGGNLSKLLGVKDFDDLANKVADKLSPAFEFLSQEVLPDVKQGFSNLLNAFKPLGEFISGAFSSAWNVILKPALQFMGNTAIPLLVDVLTGLYRNVLKPIAGLLGGVLSDAIKGLSDMLSEIYYDVLLPFGKFLKDNFEEEFVVLGEFFSKTLIPIIGELIDIFSELYENILKPIISFIGGSFVSTVKLKVGAISKIIEGVKTTFSGIVQFITGVLSGNWKSAWEGIQKIFESIWKAICGKVGLHFAPVIVFFKNIGKTLAKITDLAPLKNVFKNAKNAIIDIINNAIDLLNRIPMVDIPKIAKDTEDEIEDSTDNIKDDFDDVGDTASSVVSGIGGVLDVAQTDLSNTAKSSSNLSNTAQTSANNTAKSFADMGTNVGGSLSSVNGNIGGTKGSFDSLAITAGTTSTSVSGSIGGMKKSSNSDMYSMYSNANGLNGSIGGLATTAGATSTSVAGSIGGMKKSSNASLYSTYNNVNGLNGSIGGLATTAGNASASVAGSIGGMKKNSNPNLVSVYNNVNGVTGTLITMQDYTKTPFSVKIYQSGVSDVTNAVSNLAISLANVFEYSGKTLTLKSTIDAAASGAIAGSVLVKGYATGGYPDQYSMFMAGEQGKVEMLGTVGGRTAVAGGAEITGIREAILNTAQQQIAYMGQEIELLTGILNKQYGISKSDIGKASRDYAKDYKNRTGRDAYAF